MSDEPDDRHADDRDEKRRKARHGMRVSGGSIKRTLLPLYGNQKGNQKPKPRRRR